MKTFILVALFSLITSSAFAAPKQLECTSGVPFESFAVTLDDEHMANGYWNPTNPGFTDNYMTLVNLTCVGHRLRDLTCVGFPFGNHFMIAEVTLVKKGNQYFSKFNNLKGKSFSSGGHWPCTVK